MSHDDYEALVALEVLGTATAEEETALRAHLEQCRACGRVRDEMAEAVTFLARDLDPATPPGETREQLMRTIAGSDEVHESHRFTKWWLATAATFFLALWGWREIGIRVAHERNVHQQHEIERLAAEKRVLEQQKEKLSAEMAALASLETTTIALRGQEASPSASARVFLEPSRRRALVFFVNLPRNPPDKSYQLWIIPANAPKPVSAGVFDASPSGSASLSVENLPVATEIKALAVTLEPRGGVAQPTSSRFYVMGGI
jgi:hypothetical protein